MGAALSDVGIVPGVELLLPVPPGPAQRYGGALGAAAAHGAVASNATRKSCTWWVLRHGSDGCRLYSSASIATGGFQDCASCIGTGPHTCPGASGAPEEADAAMTTDTVAALIEAAGTARQQMTTPKQQQEADVQFLERMTALDDMGFFGVRRGSS